VGDVAPEVEYSPWAYSVVAVESPVENPVVNVLIDLEVLSPAIETRKAELPKVSDVDVAIGVPVPIPVAVVIPADV